MSYKSSYNLTPTKQESLKVALKIIIAQDHFLDKVDVLMSSTVCINRYMSEIVICSFVFFSACHFQEIHALINILEKELPNPFILSFHVSRWLEHESSDIGILIVQVTPDR
jgi:hypothetical protein